MVKRTSKKQIKRTIKTIPPLRFDQPTLSFDYSYYRSFAAKIALVAGCVYAIGLPVLHWASIVTLLLLTILTITGRVSYKNRSSWVMTLLSCALIVVATNIPLMKIEEGHNFILFPNADNPALQQALPPEIYQFAKTKFAATYPQTDTTCDPKAAGCWRGIKIASRPYAFSADAFWQQPKWSRTTSGFRFFNVVQLRSGFLNTNRLGTSANWYEWISQGDPKRRYAPYFVKYELPIEAANSNLCIFGLFSIKTPKTPHRLNKNEQFRCFTLQPDRLPSELIGLQFGNQDRFLAILNPSRKQATGYMLKLSLGILSALLLIAAWVRPRWEISIPLAGFAVFAHLVGGLSLFYIHYYQLHPGGNDHLTHWGYGRAILEHLKHGDWYQALKGTESVFYFMPGYRYFRAAEMMVFGESGMASWAAVLLTPGLIFLLLRVFIPAFPALFIGGLFTLLVINAYTKEAANLAESVSYPLAISGLIIGISTITKGKKIPQGSMFRLFLSAALLAVAVLLRPNLLPASFLFLFMLWVFQVNKDRIRTTLALAAGFSISLLLLLHNLYFGGEWVLLTAASDIPQNALAPPSVWGNALWELLSGQWDGRDLHYLAGHLSRYFLGSAGIYTLGALVLLLLAIPVLYSRRQLRQTIKRIKTSVDRPLGLLIVFWLGLQVVVLLYHPNGRYAFLAGMISVVLIGVLAWRCWVGDRSWPVVSAMDDFFDQSLKAGPGGAVSAYVQVWPCGLVPIAPGTAGSAAAAVVGFGLNSLWGWQTTLFAASALAITGTFAAHRYCIRHNQSDPKEIVIDEAAGQLIVSAAAGLNPWLHGLGFILFRVFDITKPQPIRKLESLPGGVGVMADDIAAAIAAAAIILAITYLMNTIAI